MMAYKVRVSSFHMEAFVISIMAMLFIFRPSCPFFSYPFIVMYLIFAGYFFIKYRSQIISQSIAFLRSQWVPLILLVILLIDLILSNKIYLAVLKEILNAVVIFSLFFELYLVTDSRKRFSEFTSIFRGLLIAFGIFISTIELIELFDIMRYPEMLSRYQVFSNNLRLTNDFDYNFAIVPIILGLLVLLDILRTADSLRSKIAINLFIVYFSTAICLSGSFRGLLVLMSIYTALYLFRIFTAVYNFAGKKPIVFRYNSVLITNLSVLFLLFLFFNVTSGSFRTNTLELLGSKNIREVKFNISAYVYKYLLFVDGSTTYNQLYDRLWTPSYDPKDPDSGWGTRIHTDVYPLTGNNSVIVPQGSVGYMMDHNSDADSSDPQYIRIWSSVHFEDRQQRDSNFVATIYCYASEDFNGSYARLYCSKALAYYDLSRKGTWQLLEIKFYSREKIPVEFEWAIPRGAKMKNVKGFVIFSYPQYGNGNISMNDQIRPRYNLSGFSGSEFIIQRAISIFAQPLKDLLNGILKEDSVYKSPNMKMIFNDVKESVTNNRTLRWKFAIQIFKDEYSFKEKVIGGGFAYLNWYGYYFLRDKTRSEFPHNPFLNILLYSGITGLLLYCFLMLKAVLYYRMYQKEYAFYFILFFIVYFFTFFSGSSPFDPPVMCFFIILPFFIRSIYNKPLSIMDQN